MRKYNTSKNISVAILLGSLTIAIAILVSAFSQYLAAQNPKPPSQQEVYENISYVTVSDSPTLGDKNAPITVIEYTDFDCPVCESATKELLPALRREYIDTGKVKFVFKSLPLVTLHTNAFRKTEAAFCAREQKGDEGFFRYYYALFDFVGFSLSVDTTLVNIAQKQDLALPEFKSCLAERRYKSVIDAEIVEANLIGSLGTPTWLVGKTEGEGLKDAVKITGLIEYESFRIILEKLLKKE